MALLGFHIVVSLIAATLFNKFQPQFVFCERLIYSGAAAAFSLAYYWLPEPPDAAADSRLRRRAKNRGELAAVDWRRQLLTIAADTTIVSRITYYASLVWLVDYALVSVAVFTLSHTYVLLFPHHDATNVAVLWTIFSMTFAMQVLFKLLWKKSTNANLGAEHNLIFMFSLIIFIVFMVLNMLFGERYIDENLNAGYDALVLRTQQLAETDAMLRRVSVANSPLFLFIAASLGAALLGAAYLMPVLQYATLYRNCIADRRDLKAALHHAAFLLPVFILPAYLQPVQAQVLKQFPQLSHEIFVAVRLYAVIVWSLLRVITAKALMQAYFETAREKALAAAKYADAFDTLRSHLSYFCATALQLIAPALIVLFAALTSLSLGHIFPLNIAAKSPTSRMPNYFDVLLTPTVQRCFWTYGVFCTLTIHTLISMTALVFGA